MIHRLMALGVLKQHPLTLVDVGMRAGIQGYWPVLQDCLRVIGFEPDRAEFEALSAQRQPWTQIVLPYALDSTPRTRTFYQRAYNRAADGFFIGRRWWMERLGRKISDLPRENYAVSLPERDAIEEADAAIEVQTTTFDHVAQEHALGPIDFMKIDTEGAELDILKGAEAQLGPGGVLGLEIEVRTLPTLTSPLFHEVYAYLYERGFYLADVDLYRRSRAVLPLPVAADHRDHNNAPLAAGHTIGGQIAVGDALFMRDMPTEAFWPATDEPEHLYRIIKHACLYELFAMPDCAAELLAYYREPLLCILDVDELLTYLVPDYFEKPVLYRRYLDIYEESKGRLGPSSHWK